MTDIRTLIRDELGEYISDDEAAWGATDAVLRVIDTPHVLEVTDDGWFLEHSLACRAAGLRDCEIHARIHTKAQAGPPPMRGRYVAAMTDDDAGGRYLTLTATDR